MVQETNLPELTRRQEEILSLIVRSYTQQPEPVSSKHLVEAHQLGISSATVRNEMARLEEMGYITAPHTSAGRIPTAMGYRYFVRQLIDSDELSPLERSQIDTKFDALPRVLEQWMKQAATVLARTASTASLVTPPVSETRHFKHVELIAIQGRLVLMVLVLQGGMVHQRMLNLAEPVAQTALSEAAERINMLCNELTANQIRMKCHQLPMLERDVAEIAAELIERAGSYQARVLYRDGLSDIINSFPDGEGAQQAVRVFEERAFLSMILTEILQPLMEDDQHIHVVIAGNGRWEELNQLSMVLSHYGIPGQLTGALGVLGPTNINYERAISTVRHVSNRMTTMLMELYNDGQVTGDADNEVPPALPDESN